MSLSPCWLLWLSEITSQVRKLPAPPSLPLVLFCGGGGGGTGGPNYDKQEAQCDAWDSNIGALAPTLSSPSADHWGLLPAEASGSQSCPHQVVSDLSRFLVQAARRGLIVVTRLLSIDEPKCSDVALPILCFDCEIPI